MQDKAEVVRLLQKLADGGNIHLFVVLIESSKQTGPWLKTLSVHQLVGHVKVGVMDQLLMAGASCNKRDLMTGDGPVHKVRSRHIPACFSLVLIEFNAQIRSVTQTMSTPNLWSCPCAAAFWPAVADYVTDASCLGKSTPFSEVWRMPMPGSLVYASPPLCNLESDE